MQHPPPQRHSRITLLGHNVNVNRDDFIWRVMLRLGRIHCQSSNRLSFDCTVAYLLTFIPLALLPHTTGLQPFYPKELYDIIFEHHSRARGGFFRALDVGCGPGTATETIASRFSKGIIGCDINEKQLTIARKRLANLAPKVQFIKSAAEDLSWIANSSVDMVTCAEAIHCMVHPFIFQHVTGI
ncbi:S-adenosyl-L-methionine-dependent methyltransferase [Clavulina sp. PMI_390]|nr:S-adenosyl-L-methionine-dependent methyltransferase [Clavulina sp. PMI_390]